MKHRAHKAKFGYGQDANTMLLRKLASNFFLEGKLKTTKQKAKAAQSAVERIVTKAKTNTNADNNYILKHITTKKVMDVLIKQIAPQLVQVKSGYTRLVHQGQRQTDGAEIAQLEWAYPVVLKEDKPVIKKKTAVTPKVAVEKKAETVKEPVIKEASMEKEDKS